MYYFDQAATSLKKPKVVAEAVYHAIASETIGNPNRGGHEASMQATRMVYQTRVAVKKLFNASNYHVVLTKNATESLNIAIKGLFKKGDHIITTVLEHNAVLRPVFELKDEGVALDFVQCIKGTDFLLYEQFECLCRDNTKAIIITHASNVTGSVVDLERISRFCKRKKIKLIVDASQTAGIIDIDLDGLDVDVFCFTGHKSLYGPQGTGGMCIKKGIEVCPLITGGSGSGSFSRTQPKGLPESLEAGTLNTHGLAGLLAGIDYVLEETVEVISKKVEFLTKTFYNSIKSIDSIQIYSDNKEMNTGIVAFNIGSYDSTEISSILDEQYNILIRPGIHCAPLLHRSFGTETQGMVRFSFSAFNTIEEVKYAVQAIKMIIRELE